MLPLAIAGLELACTFSKLEVHQQKTCNSLFSSCRPFAFPPLSASLTDPRKGKFSRRETKSIGRFLEGVYMNQENLRCSLWLQGRYNKGDFGGLQKYATNWRQRMGRPKEEEGQYLRLGLVRMVRTHPAAQLKCLPLFLLPSQHCCGFESWHHSGHRISFHCNHMYVILAMW